MGRLDLSRMKPLLIFAAILLAACSTTEIRVVDNRGMPVQGVLVLSEQPAFILQSWKFAAYVTDSDGKAEVVSNRGHVVSPGYYPVVDGSDLIARLVWSLTTPFEPSTVIYPISAGTKPVVDIKTFVTPGEVGVARYEVPIPFCSQLKAVYDTETSNLSITSAQKDLRPSARFHFVDPASEAATDRISGVDQVAFYCRDDGGLHKVGISTSDKTWARGRPLHRLTIFHSKIESLNAYIEPQVKCFDKDSFSFGHLHEGRRPKLYQSDNLKKEIERFRTNLPCVNDESKALIDHIERLM